MRVYVCVCVFGLFLHGDFFVRALFALCVTLPPFGFLQIAMKQQQRVQA